MLFVKSFCAAIYNLPLFITMVIIKLFLTFMYPYGAKNKLNFLTNEILTDSFKAL